MTASAASAPAAEPAVRRIELASLRIRDFRNLAAIELELPADGLALIGDNGHGKTNLLEAIYYLQLFRSFRGARDTELVRFGATAFHVAASASGARAARMSAGFECGIGRRPGRKRILIDGAEPEAIADAVGVIPAVLFAPRDAVIVAGAPSERRRFLDVMLSLASRPYLRTLQRYRAALVRRNLALRDAQRGGHLDAVAAWEPALAQAGAALVAARAHWARIASPAFTTLCAEIGERGHAAMHYHGPVDDAPDAADALQEALERRRALHVRRGMTLDGPHRDDLALELDERELRTYGSAGQQRTAAIALRLLEASTLRDACTVEPLVLLDDPFAELDVRRASRILELLEHGARGQTVLAVPREDEIPHRFTRLERHRVVHGSIRGDA
ncbi:MAG TPA: DNA replication and repair protein RecF [Gemmatimonadaceae bacterium]|nr:DNA replication and repair protein RecF [Gemmatimonadaceae bacterium]